jgi:hypothetical protein
MGRETQTPTKYYFTSIVAITFIDGGNRSTPTERRRVPCVEQELHTRPGHMS